MVDFSSERERKSHNLEDHDDVDYAIDAQIDYVREQFKWYDTRYTWSTVWSLGNVYYIFTNAVPIVKIRHSASFLEYIVSILLAFVFFCMSIGGTTFGMVPFQLWGRKVREAMGCTSFMWSKNVANYATASDFAASLMTLDIQGVRKARAEELWRLSKLNEQRESGLVWARIGAILLSLSSFVYSLAVLGVTGSLKFPILH